MTRDLRKDLPPMPAGIAALPVGPNGYPVPWFVQWIDGKPEFRIMDGRRFQRAIMERLCWTCGRKLGADLAFVIGPMCAVNRISSEPPSHPECAAFTVRACPFLSRPHMARREGGLPAETHSAGTAILRNPGVALVWLTRTYGRVSDGRGGMLLRVGKPIRISCYAEGRLATKPEVIESIQTGLPLLREIAEKQGVHAVRALRSDVGVAMRTLGYWPGDVTLDVPAAAV